MLFRKFFCWARYSRLHEQDDEEHQQEEERDLHDSISLIPAHQKAETVRERKKETRRRKITGEFAAATMEGLRLSELRKSRIMNTKPVDAKDSSCSTNMFVNMCTSANFP